MEQYERMEWDRDNQPGPCESYDPKYGPIEGYDPLANWTDPLTVWKECAQPTGWGSPPVLSPQHKVYSPSRPTGDATQTNLA